jgi:predicted small lipoprotein YifL
MNYMMPSIINLIALVFATSFLSACGQKGPLYVPVKPPAVTTPYPTSSTMPTALPREENNPESTKD